MTMQSNRQRRTSQMSFAHHLSVCGAHAAILLIVAAYSCKSTFHTWVADAAGQSRTTSMLSNENGDGMYENDVDGIVGGRRNRLQKHREKEHRALLPHEEGVVEPSKPSDEEERQDPNQSSVEKARSLSHGVKGPRKDKIGDVPEDDEVTKGGKKGKKRKETSWDSWDEPEHGKDGYVCVEYALPKSGKSKRSKTSKSEGSKGSADQESNWEKHRALLSNEEVEDVVEEQGPNEADDNLRNKKGPGKKKVTVKEDLVVMAGWKEGHGNKMKKKKNHHEPDDEAVCVKWELIIAEIV